jgi:hypothetical protein
MQAPTTTRHRTPYGLAFPLHELVFVRDWARRAGLRVSIRLDQVLDGAEFEEMVVLTATGRPCRAVSLWRTANGVIAQQAGGQPRVFAGARAALSFASLSLSGLPAARYDAWWRGLVHWARLGGALAP